MPITNTHTQNVSSGIPSMEFLYHTCLTIINPETDIDVGQCRVYVLGSHANLGAAKQFARHSLSNLGYSKTEFNLFEEQKPHDNGWHHPDGVMIYATAPKGQELIISIDTKLNEEKLAATPNGGVFLPHGVDHLHYSTVDLKQDFHVFTEIQGAYLRRSDAVTAAKRCLVNDKVGQLDYAQYDVRDDVQIPDEWPYGEDVFVHALTHTGENYMVAIRRPSSKHLAHE
ncbi:LOW QUALITY PROTEIN: hypothetical protein LZ30DRAFT_752420 [Colletotrichum cereale]|nr:LOW QUALITY PROTEIN: hypothetical protein LZ30DRAFT_752420 [Colletotrichum cereale]